MSLRKARAVESAVEGELEETCSCTLFPLLATERSSPLGRSALSGASTETRLSLAAASVKLRVSEAVVFKR
jgi:hypothetical protein